MTNSASTNEQVRGAVLRFLAERPSLSFDSPTIWQRVHAGGYIDHSATPHEIDHALSFLISAQFAEGKTRGSLGVTPFYQVTHKGVLEHERSL